MFCFLQVWYFCHAVSSGLNFESEIAGIISTPFHTPGKSYICSFYSGSIRIVGSLAVVLNVPQLEKQCVSLPIADTYGPFCLLVLIFHR